jgi:hypothetical protein
MDFIDITDLQPADLQPMVVTSWKADTASNFPVHEQVSHTAYGCYPLKSWYRALVNTDLIADYTPWNNPDI